MKHKKVLIQSYLLKAIHYMTTKHTQVPLKFPTSLLKPHTNRTHFSKILFNLHKQTPQAHIAYFPNSLFPFPQVNQNPSDKLLTISKT